LEENGEREGSKGVYRKLILVTKAV